MILSHTRSHPEMSSVMRALDGAPMTVQVCSVRCHTSLGVPWPKIRRGSPYGYSEAVRVQAPGVLRRVPRGLVLVDGASASLAHGLDEASRPARVLHLEIRLCLTLISLSQRIVKQHSPALHVRPLVQLLGLKDHVVNQVRHTPHRVVRPGHPLYHTGPLMLQSLSHRKYPRAPCPRHQNYSS